MKRRLSFLIALVMVLSLLPAMSVSAATTNRVLVNGGTVEDDYDWEGNQTGMPFLSIILASSSPQVDANSRFSLYLSNAEFDTDNLDDDLYITGANAVWTNERQLDVTANGVPISAAGHTSAVGYTMMIRSATVAEIVLNDAITDGDIMVIPMPIVMVGEGPATVSIADTAGTLVTPTSSLTLATGTSGTTKTSVTKSTQTFSRYLELGDITITETVINTIDRPGSLGQYDIELFAPSGFEWVGYGTTGTGVMDPKAIGMVGFASSVQDYATGSTRSTSMWRDTNDKAKLVIDTSWITNASGSARSGSIMISGLVLERTDSISSTTSGDVRVRVKVPGGETEYITVGVFANRSVTITAQDKALPEIVSGVYTNDPQEDKTQVLDVWIKETSAQAWNLQGDALFTLPKGVKFRAAEIKDSSGFRTAPQGLVTLGQWSEGTTSPSYGRASVLSDRSLRLKDDQLTVRPVDSTRKGTAANDKVELKLRVWVTVEPGFTGDITFTTDEDNEAFGTNISAVVAKAIDPVTVSTTKTDVELGYMNLAVGDIIIKENAAGAIPRSVGTFNDRYSSSISEHVQIYIGGYSGMSSTTMGGFKSKGEATVTSGDLVIDDYRLDSGLITLETKRESTTASEIKLSGMTIDTNRDIPQGKLELRMKGSLAANWHQNREYKDGGAFGVEYIVADEGYINVITAAPGSDVKYTTEVSIGIGSDTLTANGVDYDLEDVRAFIQDEYTMVPVRAVAVAIGVSNDMIIWDANAKTVTILDTNRNRTSQFTQGSSVVRQSGIDIGFSGPSAMNVSGRVYLPFRALGEIVLGCPVDWDPETRTAYFNRQAK